MCAAGFCGSRKMGGGKRSTIIILASGLDDFKRVVGEMVKTSDKLPEKPAPPADDV